MTSTHIKNNVYTFCFLTNTTSTYQVFVYYMLICRNQKLTKLHFLKVGVINIYVTSKNHDTHLICRLDTFAHVMSETFSPHVSAKSASITSPQPSDLIGQAILLSQQYKGFSKVDQILAKQFFYLY